MGKSKRLLFLSSFVFCISNKKYQILFFRAAQIALFLFSLSIFFSYALQFYVLIEILAPNVIKPLVNERWYSLVEYIVRIILNIITCKFQNIIVLISAVGYFDEKDANLHILVIFRRGQAFFAPHSML